jgi:hypothetical protein
MNMLNRTGATARMRDFVTAAMRAFGLPAKALAPLAGLNEPVVSAWLDGKRALSQPGQFRLAEVLNALTQLRIIAGIPEDWEDTEDVMRLIAPFMVRMDAEDGAQFAREIREAGEAAGD